MPFNLQAIHKLIIPNEQTVIFNILIGKELLTETFLNLFKIQTLFHHFILILFTTFLHQMEI